MNGIENVTECDTVVDLLKTYKWEGFCEVITSPSINKIIHVEVHILRNKYKKSLLLRFIHHLK